MTRRFVPSRLALWVVAVMVPIAPPAHAGFITFQDGTFNNSDWGTSVFLHGTGGSSTASQFSIGSNPDSYFRVTNIINDAAAGDFASVWAFYYNSAAVYDPSFHGAISSIDSAQDAIIFSGSLQSIRVGLRQNGKVYSAGGISPQDSSWTTVTFSDLTQADFLLVDPTQGYPIDPDAHPDFSPSGSQIEFGFLRTNSTATVGGTGYTVVGGVDNWSLTVRTAAVPEPSTVVLASIGGSLLLVGARWRRWRARE